MLHIVDLMLFDVAAAGTAWVLCCFDFSDKQSSYQLGVNQSVTDNPTEGLTNGRICWRPDTKFTTRPQSSPHDLAVGLR